MELDFPIRELIGHDHFGDEDFELEFRIGEQLGYDQFSAVHQCISVATGKAFAVKIIDKLSDFFDRQMVYSEIKLTFLVASGNSRCIQIHRVYEDPTAVYLIFDLCSSPDLAEAIAKCHRRGIIHCDIKLENILFDSNGPMILDDFGCTALLEKGSRTLKEKIGTPIYMVPEMIAGKEYDEKVDVWSVGLVLYMMLGGTLPFNGTSKKRYSLL